MKVAIMAIMVNAKLNTISPSLNINPKNTGARVIEINPRIVIIILGVNNFWILPISPDTDKRKTAAPHTAIAV